MCLDAQPPISRPWISTHTRMLMLMKMPKMRLATPPIRSPIALVAPLATALRAFWRVALAESICSLDTLVELSDFWIESQAFWRLSWISGHWFTRPYRTIRQMPMASRMRKMTTRNAAIQRLTWCRASQSTTGRNVPPMSTANRAARTTSLIAAITTNTQTATRITAMMIQPQRPVSWPRRRGEGTRLSLPPGSWVSGTWCRHRDRWLPLAPSPCAPLSRPLAGPFGPC